MSTVVASTKAAAVEEKPLDIYAIETAVELTAVANGDDGMECEYPFSCFKIPKHAGIEESSTNASDFFWIFESETECSSMADVRESIRPAVVDRIGYFPAHLERLQDVAPPNTEIQSDSIRRKFPYRQPSSSFIRPPAIDPALSAVDFRTEASFPPPLPEFLNDVNIHSLLKLSPEVVNAIEAVNGDVSVALMLKLMDYLKEHHRNDIVEEAVESSQAHVLCDTFTNLVHMRQENRIQFLHRRLHELQAAEQLQQFSHANLNELQEFGHDNWDEQQHLTEILSSNLQNRTNGIAKNELDDEIKAHVIEMVDNVDFERCTLAAFLLRRLKEVGCDHIFGVPGDFVLGFFNEILKSEVNYVGTCNELNAAYAADGYARLKGIGCLSTTYSVGELSAINGVAGSFAECVPVVHIAGVPATKFYREQPLLHHTLGDYQAPYKMYQHVTVAQAILSEPEMAAAEIDRVLQACLQQKKPIYIGIPSDMVVQSISAPSARFRMPMERRSDPNALDEAILEALRMLHQSRKPLFIPGTDIIRYGLEKKMMDLIDTSGIPFVTMMLSKAMFDEDHPQFIGLYSGDRSRKYVRERVETSDCLVIFGEKLTDFNTGGFSAAIDRRSTIEILHHSVRIMFHVYNNVYIHDFIRELTLRIAYRPSRQLDIHPATEGCVHRQAIEYIPEPDKTLTMGRMFDRMAHFFKPGGVVIAETGASLFSAAEVLLPKSTKFIGQTFYGSIGFTVGATLGVCIADPSRDVYLFVGDGSFQVTCQDMSTMIRYGCKPTIFLVNNDGYTIERVIVDRVYNDVQPWKYHMLTTVFGGGKSFEVTTEGELEIALTESDATDDLTFIEVHLGRWDCNQALREAGRAMALNNNLLDEGEAMEARANRSAAAKQGVENDEYVGRENSTSVYHRGGAE